MSTDLQPVEPDGKLLQAAFCEEAFEKLSAQVAELDATTDEGYEKTKNGIRWCVKARSAVTALKEEKNRAALAHQRAVNADEKKLIALIKTVEDPLVAKKKAVDDEVERKRKELEAKHEAWIVGRQDHFFAETGNLLPRVLAEEMSEPDFEQLVAAGREAKQKAALEAARIAQQEAEEKEAFRQAQAKLAAEKAEFERQQAELKAAQELLARQQAEQAEREREAERKIELQRQQEERDAERKKLLDMPSMRHEPFFRQQEERDAERKKLKAESDPVQPVAEAMANFLEFQYPGLPEAEADEDLKGESPDALVIDSGDVDEDEMVRKLIAPIHSEVMVRLVRMQNEAKALEAMFDDFEAYLMEYESMAADIRLAVEALQEEMDKFEPK